MDLPVFHLDFLNNRMLIAIIAVLHVVIKSRDGGRRYPPLLPISSVEE